MRFAMLLWVGSLQAASVTETVLGTLPALGLGRMSYLVSQSGTNIATVMRDGAGEVAVSFRGAGGKYERIMPRSLRWVNERLVYLGQRDGGYFLVDGEKVTRLPGLPVETAGDRPLVTPDGTQYVLFVAHSGGITAWLNGKPTGPKHDRIPFVPAQQRPRSTVLYAGQRDCSFRLVGQKSSAAVKWTVLSGYFASEDASSVFAWGEIKGTPTLARNGEVISQLNPNSRQFTADRAGQNWLVVVDRSASTADRSDLLFNGAPVAQCDVSSSFLEVVLSSTNGVWAWIIPSDDQTSAVLKMRGRPEASLPGYAVESFRLADDGSRTAWFSHEEGRGWIVDGAPVADQPTVNWRTFQFGPGKAFAYVGEGAGKSVVWVTTEAGPGKAFAAVSEPVFTPAGVVSYAAKTDAQRFLIIGSEVIELNADDLLFASLRVSTSRVSIVGKLGNEFRQFSVLAK